MSLSQKHSGKVLVPWFNIAEWKAVYDLIYTEDKQNWPKALQVLKIWKHRTPLLSAGVEGTLIILEALLVNTNRLSLFEITHIFSTSLMRFLNLCAANSDKQGTFYKSAMKNGLPKWLVGVRHDIAHSHKVPPQSMLELSLKYCLDWIKGKYWDVQFKCMSDLIANQSDETLLEDAIYVHVHLTKTEIHRDDKDLMQRINRLVKSHSKKHLSNKKILENVDRVLKDVIRSDAQGSVHRICRMLIDSFTMLSVKCELDKSGTKMIPRDFVRSWSNLLNLFHEAEILPLFIYKLLDFICNEAHHLLYREIASLWIREIFQGFINKDNSKHNKGLCFNSNTCMKDKNFATQILEKLTPFSLNFIKEVLEYNDAPPDFIEDSINLVSAFTTLSDVRTNGIFTVDDLNFEFTDSPVNESSKDAQMHSNSRWMLIEDTSAFKNLPLGILPHQPRNINPLLDL